MYNAYESNNAPSSDNVTSSDTYTSVVKPSISIDVLTLNGYLPKLQEGGGSFEKTLARTNQSLYAIISDIYRIVAAFNWSKKEERRLVKQRLVRVCKELNFQQITEDDDFSLLLIKSVFGRGTDRRRFYIYKEAIALLCYVQKSERRDIEKFDVVAYLTDIGGVEEAKNKMLALRDANKKPQDEEAKAKKEAKAQALEERVSELETLLESKQKAIANFKIEDGNEAEMFSDSKLTLFIGRQVGDKESKEFDILIPTKGLKRDLLKTLLTNIAKPQLEAEAKQAVEQKIDEAEDSKQDAIDEARQSAEESDATKVTMSAKDAKKALSKKTSSTKDEDKQAA